ncbi:hypothetical protein KSD_09060 [Ktedonobacter sp. SOSP1-85]|uniref:Uncharacterized protein n=1 Tax=Ktedonobacter robiniae TaxID=2778365 RepID=A0ABQ3UR27_9CHLR|nr:MULTISPECIES: hypothetical protein [Ktedonobacter]GHO55244.1 hypothetical protein KSB_37190 [Ktedonobacter robiniae]GHO73135.1 hypothetical protein KSD_09060 [Ktedonobacter sp. SOSP1-85]
MQKQIPSRKAGAKAVALDRSKELKRYYTYVLIATLLCAAFALSLYAIFGL